MRLVTWNCNGALRRKHALLEALDADILVIQECEDPSQSTAEYQAWAKDYAWIGYGKNKGIGIFPRRGQRIEPLDWPASDLKLFLPVRVDDKYDVVGVWTQKGSPSNTSYIGQFWHYLRAHGERFGQHTIIAGDLNSNAIWDKPRRLWNHSDCVREMAMNGFHSLYHLAHAEDQGMERQPTFYLHRSELKPYHIDYIFAHDALLNGVRPSVEVGNRASWIDASDHMPITVELPEPRIMTRR